MNSPLLTRPVSQVLLSMAAPAAFGMLMTFLFQLVDAWFIGQLGTAELAAISYAYPVYILLVGLMVGAAAGVSAAVGQALGKGQPGRARQLTLTALLLFSGLTMLVGLLGAANVQPLFSLLGASDGAITLIGQYMEPLYLGIFLLTMGLVANSALMAKGIMLASTAVMALGGLVNLVFDYLLIFGVGPFPAMGLMGAAYATLLSWLVIALLMLVLLHRHRLLGQGRLSPAIFARRARSILPLAMPAILAQILAPLAIAALTRLVSAHGEAAVAAFGIVVRVESLALTGILALSVVLTPVVAQHYGAKAWQRLDQVVAWSGRLVVYWGLALFGLLLWGAEPILTLFSQKQEVIQAGLQYFYWVGLSFPALGLTLIAASFLNGVQQPLAALQLILLKSLGLTIPLAWLGSSFGLSGIWAALSLANLLGAVFAYRFLYQWLKEQDSALVERRVWLDYRDDLLELSGRFRVLGRRLVHHGRP